MELTWRGYQFSVLVRIRQPKQAKPGAVVPREKAASDLRDAKAKCMLASGCRSMTLTR